MRKKIFLTAIFFILPFLLTGCVRINTGRDQGGVFKSFNKMEEWEQKVFVSQVKKKKTTIGNANVTNIALNPQDSNFIYLGTKEDGLHISFDGGEKWSSVLSKKGQIESVAFDFKSSTIAYASMGSKIFKTTNQGDDWEEVYLDANQKIINFLAVDPNDSEKVYAGLSDGRLLRSLDYGKSWLVLNDFGNSIEQVLINKNNSNIIYTATLGKGFFKSADQGESWEDLTKDLKFSGVKKFKWAVFDSTKDDGLVIAAKYGLLKTDDGGKNWQEINLLSLPGKIDILCLAINPFDANEIYYGTKEALFKTIDGGKTWKTISLPSDRAPFYLAVDNYNPDVIYLGVAKIK